MFHHTTTTRRHRWGLVLCLFLQIILLASGLEQVFLEPGGGLVGVDAGSAQSSAAATRDFILPNDFYKAKCDPCIPRSEYWVQVIVHGTQSDVYWQQVQSAMQQASRDTGVALELELHDDSTPADQIDTLMASKIRQASTKTGKERPDALIVTIPSPAVSQAVSVALAAKLPVFGFHTGYEVAQTLGVLGFVAQDEKLAGSMVAEELLRIPSVLEAVRDNNSPNNATTLAETSAASDTLKVVFINHDDQDKRTAARYQGLQSGLHVGSNGTGVTVTQLRVNPEEVFETVQTLNNDVFLGCPYDVVVLGGPSLVDIALSALVDLGCSGKVVLTSFGMSSGIVEGVVQGQIQFAAAPQQYIESVFVVVMASMFVTTGKKLSLPQDSNIYLSGPVIITRDNVPTDSVEICREQAFPVCDADGVPLAPPVLSSGVGTAICNDYGCLPRKTIRIGGVTHGVSTDAFWDPVFASARQAAVDLGIDLELERIERQENYDIVHAKMAARIETLCQSGVDGIFVSIPSDTLLDSIRLCQSLNVPVISVNTGEEISQELGLLGHIGQMEYSSGYAAGQRLAREGIKEAYCLNHQFGHLGLAERCRGFGDALEIEYPDVDYHGMFAVADDNNAQYTLAVEIAVAEHSPNVAGSWDGIGFLLVGATQVSHMEALISTHANAVAGSYDLSETMYGPFTNEWLMFGIDQQPFLQGSLPVFLLTYAAYTQQSLINDVIETGPHFVLAEPTVDQKQCEATFFSICSILPKEDMRLISPSLQIVGYVLVSLTIFMAFTCMAFVAYYRTTSILVRISQPPFLILLCCGCIVSSLSIIPMGVQTEYRYGKDTISTGLLTDEENPDIKAVDAACMMVPWFYSVGFALVFSSLFGKIWRVQKVFKAGESFRRKAVTFMEIAPYMAIMFVVSFALLITWQIAAPFHWERYVTVTDIEGYALESFGKCTSDDGWYYWLAILCFQVLCLFYALVLCFRTKHIQDDFSESSNTFLSVIMIFQVNVLAMPIGAMVRDDTQVFYFVRGCAVFLQNFTVLCLMFLPKMYRVFTGDDALPDIAARSSTRTSGGARSSVRVSFSPQFHDSSNFSLGLQASSCDTFGSKASFLDGSFIGTGMDSRDSIVSRKLEEKAPEQSDKQSDVSQTLVISDIEAPEHGIFLPPTEQTRPEDEGGEPASSRELFSDEEVGLGSTPAEVFVPVIKTADDDETSETVTTLTEGFGSEVATTPKDTATTTAIDCGVQAPKTSDSVDTEVRLSSPEALCFSDAATKTGTSLRAPETDKSSCSPSPRKEGVGPDASDRDESIRTLDELFDAYDFQDEGSSRDPFL